MTDYTDQFNQERAQSRQKRKINRKSTKSNTPDINISSVEWAIIFSLAIISDLVGPIGFLCAPFILFWHTSRFHKFPLKKFIGFGLVEAVSLGILPGWTGFVLMSYLKNKGRLNWLNKLKLA